MKIDNKDNVTVLRLRHKGYDAKWMCHVKPVAAFGVYQDLQPSEVACIEFADMKEVDTLIDILTRFRNDTESNVIGIWKKGL